MSYDSKCYDLAVAFLHDEPEMDTETKRCALAQTIQNEIENWITWERDHKNRLRGCAAANL